MLLGLYSFNLMCHFVIGGDCVQTAVHLINRILSLLLDNKSPCEMLLSKERDYTSLRVFGCLYYVSTNPKFRTKFSPRAKPYVFLVIYLVIKDIRFLI